MVGAIAYLAIELSEILPDAHPLLIIPPALLLVTLVALIVAAPVSLVIGAPLLWIGQRSIVRWPLAGSVLLAVTGMICAIPINGWVNGGGLSNPERDLWTSMLFGGVVAGLHGVLLFQLVRIRWPATLLLGVIVAAISSTLGVLILDEHRNLLAASAMASCPRYDFASHRLSQERLAAIGKLGHRFSYEQGHWAILWGYPGLYGRYSALFVDGKRTLVAEDTALVPVRRWHRLGLTRPATPNACLRLMTPTPRWSAAPG